MKTFRFVSLGHDNGSGVFERGDAGAAEVRVDNPLSLARAAMSLAVALNHGGRIYDQSTTKVGNHYVISFCVSAEGRGEQTFVFAATEVQ